MAQKITFKAQGRWKGGGRISPSLRKIESLSDWISEFLKAFKHLGKAYTKFSSSGGALIGQEKANLLIDLDGLIGGLLILRQYVTKDNPRQFTSLSNKYNFWFVMQIHPQTWNGSGKMGLKYTFNMASFAQWYNNVMMKKLKAMFNLYVKSMEDGVLSDEECTKLIQFIELIIFDILVIERVLISKDISH